MKLLFCHDKSYATAKDGQVLSYSSFPYAFWESRFLPHFEKLVVIGRKKNLMAGENGALDISSGRNVSHVLLPNMDAPSKKILQYKRIYKKIYEQVSQVDAVVIRGPVELGVMAAHAARKLGKPYAVELSGCAYDRANKDQTLFGRYYAPVKFSRIKDMVLNANAVIYTTENFLQSRYPTNGIAQYVSNVEIDSVPEYILTQRLERIQKQEEPIKFGLIGNFQGGFRGLNESLEALSLYKQYRQINQNLPDFNLKILGQSDNHSVQEKLKELDLAAHVEFCGILPRGGSVSEWLDGIDVYLNAGHYEGLPRTLIEAMSRGCPALSSDAGGAGELLDNDFIHPYGDVQVLAGQIIGLLSGENCAQQAKRNFKKARLFSRDILAAQRYKFWEDFACLVQKTI